MNFIDFMRLVMRTHEANPNHIRLDGQLSGSNGKLFEYFEHFDHRWRVNYDTHYEPLRLAYEAARNGEEPFVIAPTNRNEEDKFKLKLKPEIREIQKQLQLNRGDKTYEYLNIYLVS